MTKPIIALVGWTDAPPAWVATLTEQLSANYQLDHYTTQENYVTRLTDDLVALVLVHSTEDWKFWTATPKSSPATRRIPVFLIGDDNTIREQAITSGADLALTPDELTQSVTKLVKDYARVYDPAKAEKLDCECGEKLPDLAIQGMQKFNAGEFYKQHDLFEELWVETEGPVRDLYRAILQVGVAYYQILRGNHRGARKMLMRSVQWLAVLPDECQGVDVKRLRDDSYRVRAELEKLKEDEIDQFDTSLLKGVYMVGEG